jgi:hypothetical protein
MAAQEAEWSRGLRTAEAVPRAVAAASAASVATGLPAFLDARSKLPSTIQGLKAMAQRVNEHYGDRLPDGKGRITVNDLSKVRNVKLNFIRRLNIPS